MVWGIRVGHTFGFSMSVWFGWVGFSFLVIRFWGKAFRPTLKHWPIKITLAKAN